MGSQKQIKVTGLTQAARPKSPTIRILIAYDHQLFAETLRQCLESHDMEVLGIVSTAEDALSEAQRLRPDVVLIDVDFGRDQVMFVGSLLLEELPETKVIAVATSNHYGMIREAMLAGFHGYVARHTPLSQLVRAIRSAVEGQVTIPHELARAAAGAEGETHLMARRLTAREREVLSLLVAGAGSKEMARRLCISPNTLRTHVQSVLTKLQVKSRLEAAAFASRNGIVKATDLI